MPLRETISGSAEPRRRRRFELVPRPNRRGAKSADFQAKYWGGGTRTHNLSVNSRTHLPVELLPIVLCQLSYSLAWLYSHFIGNSTNPASTAPWQFAHSNTHFSASARARSSDRATPRPASSKLLAAGSRWWKCSDPTYPL
jgi:hypothetical protein